MIVAKTIADNLQRASWIRRMFEEGNRLRAERGPENVFDFSLGNPEVEPTDRVIRAAQRVLAENRPHSHAYMPNAGFPETRTSQAKKMKARTELPFGLEHIVMTVGAGGALNVVLKALLDPGDEVLVLAPFFVEYGFYIQNHGGRMVLVETKPDFQPDLAAIESALGPRTKAIILNSPNNPTGVVYPAEFFDGLEQVLRRHDQPVVVVSDEPYKDLTYDGVRTPDVPRHIQNTVVATSWSKSLALPGERIGYLAISPRMPEAKTLAEACTFTNRVLGFVNAPAIWQWVVTEAADAIVDIGPYQEKRDILWNGLTRIGYECIKPQGAFYLFPRTPITDDVAFVKLLLQEGVLAVPGSGFGRSGHMRLSFTVPRETAERSLPAFERAFRNARG